MHRVCGLKIEVCYLDNAAFLGCSLFGLPSTRSRHCKKSNSNSACALQQSDSSFTVCPSYRFAEVRRRYLNLISCNGGFVSMVGRRENNQEKQHYRGNKLQFLSHKHGALPPVVCVTKESALINNVPKNQKSCGHVIKNFQMTFAFMSLLD